MNNVLLIADRPGWAFDIIAQSLASKLEKWSIHISYIVDIRAAPDTFDIRQFDLVYIFNWYDAIRYAPLFQGFNADKICVGVHSLESWRKRNWSTELTSKICNLFGGTGYISQEIGNQLKLSNGCYTPNGVDPDKFPRRRKSPLYPLKCLWVGNPDSGHHGNIKGYDDYVKPVLDALSPEVELLVACPDNFYEHDQMSQFYDKGHVLVCMSESEGCPLPVLEAMHSGLPVISTSVGVVPELVVDGKSGWIIERKREELTRVLRMLMLSPEQLNATAEDAFIAASDWTEERMADHYSNLFNIALARSENHGSLSNDDLEQTIFTLPSEKIGEILKTWYSAEIRACALEANTDLSNIMDSFDTGRFKPKSNYINSTLRSLGFFILGSNCEKLYHLELGYGEIPALLRGRSISQIVLQDKTSREFLSTEAGIAIANRFALNLGNTTSNCGNHIEETKGIVAPRSPEKLLQHLQATARSQYDYIFVGGNLPSPIDYLCSLNKIDDCWQLLHVENNAAVFGKRVD